MVFGEIYRTGIKYVRQNNCQLVGNIHNINVLLVFAIKKLHYEPGEILYVLCMNESARVCVHTCSHK